MSAARTFENLTKNPYTGLVVASAIAALVVYYIIKKSAGAVASAAGGILSGNNAVTAGTDYAGTGALGTLGAATDKVSGGIFSSIGESIGSGLYDLFGTDYNPNAPASSTNSTVPGSSDAATSQNHGATGSW